MFFACYNSTPASFQSEMFRKHLLKYKRHLALKPSVVDQEFLSVTDASDVGTETVHKQNGVLFEPARIVPTLAERIYSTIQKGMLSYLVDI